MQTSSQFSTNSTTRNQVRYKSGTIIESTYPIPCIFCGFMTSIEFDLDLHLYEKHRMELVKLPIGKGNMDVRIKYAIKDGKRIRNALMGLTQEVRESFGIYGRDNTDFNAIPSEIRVNTGTDFILNHLNEPLFPRKIMTKGLGRQIKVFDRQTILSQFKRSNYYDCRVNAYSCLFQEDESLLFYTNEIRLSITIIVIDLDLKNFDNSKEKLDRKLQETLKKVRETIGGFPTVLDTGNGYHIYQPIYEIILDDIEELKELVNFHDKYYLPNKFLKFAEKYFTDGKSDPGHNPSANSSLIRIPGTINSKCGREISILQEWDYHRPSVEPLLSAFKKHLSSQQDAGCKVEASRINDCAKHGITWIEYLLNTSEGITDFRKQMIDLVIAPYLINIKLCDYNSAYSKIREWLDKCDKRRRLDFNLRNKMSYALKRSLKTGIKPMKLTTMKNKYFDMYKEVVGHKYRIK